jgi:hypothetical protein
MARSGARRMKDSKETLLQTKTELEAGLKDLHADEPATTKAAEPAPPNRAPLR